MTKRDEIVHSASVDKSQTTQPLYSAHLQRWPSQMDDLVSLFVGVQQPHQPRVPKDRVEVDAARSAWSASLFVRSWTEVQQSNKTSVTRQISRPPFLPFISLLSNEKKDLETLKRNETCAAEDHLSRTTVRAHSMTSSRSKKSIFLFNMQTIWCVYNRTSGARAFDFYYCNTLTGWRSVRLLPTPGGWWSAPFHFRKMRSKSARNQRLNSSNQFRNKHDRFLPVFLVGSVLSFISIGLCQCGG